jgi:hypothetical protein
LVIFKLFLLNKEEIMNDAIDSSNVVRPPMNVPRRPVNYVPAQGNGNGSGNGGNSEGFKEHRKLLVKIGDMVQVIDPKSHLQGKYGLVQAIHPKNLQYQVLVKIGKINNPLKFFQIRFCTRIDPVSNGNFKKDSIANIEDDYSEKNNDIINKLIDVVDDEADNAGNYEGANLKHGKKL